MTLEITQTDNVASQGITMLVYGESGVGKTTLLGTLPEKDTLIIDVEGGIASLRKKSIAVVKVNSNLDNLSAIFEELHKTEYKNICFDSVSELDKHMLMAIGKTGKNSNVPEMQHYLIVQYKLRDYLRELRDLRDSGKNVFITALEMPLELERVDGSRYTKLYPMISKRIAPEICGLYDIVARMEISSTEGEEGNRYLRIQPTPEIVAKNRFDDSGKVNTINADLTALIGKINSKKEE